MKSFRDETTLATNDPYLRLTILTCDQRFKTSHIFNAQESFYKYKCATQRKLNNNSIAGFKKKL
jgi:hypothetical protein